MRTYRSAAAVLKPAVRSIHQRRVVAIVAVGLALVLMVAIAVPRLGGPTAFLSVGSPGPTASTAVASATAAAPAPSGALAHFQGNPWNFDYPATWRIITPLVDMHEEAYGPVLGIGDWQIPCQTIVAPTQGVVVEGKCDPPAWNVPAGGVVVQFYWSIGAGPRPEPTPLPSAIHLRDGLLALDTTETDMTSVWLVYFPSGESAGQNYSASVATVEARYGQGSAQTARGQVRAMIESMHLH